jgi:hypothetical protein
VLRPPVLSLPLDHFKRRFVLDLQAQIFKSDGQMPTVCPPQFFGLEFTEKLLLTGTGTIPLSIGVYRLDGAPRAQSRLTQFALARSLRYRQRDFLSRRHSSPCCAEAIEVRSAFNNRPLRQFGP